MFIRVYRDLFLYGLSANSTKVYIYFTQCQNCFGTAVVKISSISRACGISSVGTVYTALAELEEKGLVSRFRRRNSVGDYISNGYHVTQLKGKWFMLPTASQPLRLPKAAFVTYLCLLSHKNRRGRAFPSIRRMAGILNLCRNTIIAAIKELAARLLVAKADIWRGKHNLYILLDAPQQAQKMSGTARTPYHSTDSIPCKYTYRTPIVAAIGHFVKGVRGVFCTLHKRLGRFYCITLGWVVQKLKSCS